MELKVGDKVRIIEPFYVERYGEIIATVTKLRGYTQKGNDNIYDVEWNDGKLSNIFEGRDLQKLSKLERALR